MSEINSSCDEKQIIEPTATRRELLEKLTERERGLMLEAARLAFFMGVNYAEGYVSPEDWPDDTVLMDEIIDDALGSSIHYEHLR